MEIVVLVILILVNGFFALSEIALVSSKRARLEQRRIEGSKGAKIALKLLDNSENFLSAIQVGITLVGIVTGVYGGMNIADDVTPFFQNFEITQNYANQIALTLTVVIITYFSIVIGELVPKTIALNNPDKIAIRVAPMIYYFSSTFYPFVRLLSISTNFVNKIIGIKKQTEQLTEAELRHMLKVASSEGVIEKEQNIIHEKVFYFADKKAKHIMTHRTDVEWIDTDDSFDDIKLKLYNAKHSKLVCCSGGLDNFTGIIYLRDFYKSISQLKIFDIKTIIVEPLIVPDNMDAQKVLELFRQKKVHLCCVVNEYGGFEGLITLHDIVENIVGRIPEEGELYEPDVFIRDDNSILVSGDAPIETLNEIIIDFTVDFEKIDYSTVAGFVYNQIGKIPQVGDKVDYMDYKIEIVDVDGHKIDKILITKKK
ncbi:MAG: HlyC/CorC family transporter [Bacteroidetes bacterium]|jgi:putative hemolysin|nr:HlyC/CorC family transporter [Bacteroidota bacterium]